MPRPIALLVATLLALAPAACKGAEPKAPPATTAKANAPVVEKDAQSASPLADDTAKALEELKAAGGMESFNEALQAAVAAPPGATPCESVYNGLIEMARAVAKQAGGKAGPLPSKERFLAGCGELPVALQRCMSFAYAMSHAKECAEVQRKLDPATVAKMKSLAAP